MSDMSYDPHLLTDDNARELAQEIQDTIEDFITAKQVSELSKAGGTHAAAGKSEGHNK